MGFNINNLIRKRVVQQAKEVVLPSPEQKEEPIQEIVVPVYEPSEPIVEEVIKRKAVKNEQLVRKVPLNPLSEE